MNSKTSIACLSVALSVAALRAEIATDDALMEVSWFENAVTESMAGWSGYGLVCADAKYTLDVERAVSFRPVAHTGRAVRQVFDIDLRPVARLPEVDDGAQTSFVVRATDAGQVIAAWGRATPSDAPAWQDLGAPVYGKRLAVEIDYAGEDGAPATVRYCLTDETGDTPLGAALYSANAQTQVSQFDFTGSGTLASLTGTQTADTAAIIGGVKYAAEDVSEEKLVAGMAQGTVKVFDPNLIPEGYAVNERNELYFTGADDPDASQDGLLYYFPLEGVVANVGGSRGMRDVSVGETLDWEDPGEDGIWTGSPFGNASLRSTSAETKVFNADGLVPEGSRWTISFWVNVSREDWGWKDVCGFQIGDQIYNFERTDAKALQLYGKAGDYLHDADDATDKPIVCGDAWVNVSVTCNAGLNGIDIYANGRHHASIAVENADRLTGLYFSAYGLRSEPTWSRTFVDEVSIWGRALNEDQLAYLAQFPARKGILSGEPLFEAETDEKPYVTLGEALAAGGTVTLRHDLTVDAPLVIANGVTLDLGGFTLSAADGFPSGAAVLEVRDGGSLTLGNGTVVGCDCGVYAAAGSLTVVDGTIRATASEAADPTAGNPGKGHAIVLESGTGGGLEAVITGGVFESVGAPVVSWTRDAESAPALECFIAGGAFRGPEMPSELIQVPEGHVAMWEGPDADGYMTAVVMEAPDGEMLYYFPLEGSVVNVGGTRGMRDVTVGEGLAWAHDDGWTGSPFGSVSLRCTSDETKVCNADGIVPAGSPWTISFWLNLSCEDWDWKNACGFQVGAQIYNFRKGAGKELHLYGGSDDYLHDVNDTDEKPIVCDDAWVNVSLVFTAEHDFADVYVNGAHHATIGIEGTDALTGFYFTENGLSDEGRKYACMFIDEVSVWSCALDADQLAYLAEHPARKEILYVRKGWQSVTADTLYAEIPGLTDAQRATLTANEVSPLRLATWAIAKDVPYGDEIDLAAFAMNCAPAAKADEAAKLRLTIAMDGETPVVGIVTDADGEPVTKDWNIQPTIKGKSDLADEAWGDRNAEGVRFFKAFLDL